MFLIPEQVSEIHVHDNFFGKIDDVLKMTLEKRGLATEKRGLATENSNCL
jgi:hypothetical protein